MGHFDLTELDYPFSEEEVWAAIKDSPAEKSPGPDGFCGVFFRSCWSIIKTDIMQAFQQFYHPAGQNFGALNSAIIALIPKKDGAEPIADYRPISLPHSFSKLFANALAMRARKKMHEIVCVN